MYCCFEKQINTFAIWDSLLKLAFFLGSCVYVKLFYLNGKLEKNLFSGIKVTLLNKYRSLIKLLVSEEYFKQHLEAFASELIWKVHLFQ